MLAAISICGFVYFADNGSVTYTPNVSEANCYYQQSNYIGENGNGLNNYNFIVGTDLFDNLKKLDDFSRLDTGWNCYDAKLIPKELIKQTKTVIRVLDVQPDIFPTARESIQIEFDNEGDYLEFEIFEGNKVVMYQEKDGNEIVEEIRCEDIRKKVDDFYE